MAATEYGHMASVPSMHFAFKKHGIKYIAGCEIYYNDYEPFRQDMNVRGVKLKSVEEESPILSQRIRRNRHVTVLCKNEVGFHNLIKLTTLAHKFGFYYNPRIWFEKLCEYKEGLIIMSGCLNGPVSHEIRLDVQHILETGQKAPRQKGRDLTAVEYIKKFHSVFGDDYYLEVQMPVLEELHDHIVFMKLIEYGDDLGIKVVLANDSHYLGRKDFQVQKVMMAISQGMTVDNPDLFHVNSDEQFMKTRVELWNTFKNNQYSLKVDDRKFDEICDNALEIASRCEVLNPDTNPKIPDWSMIEPGVDADDRLKITVAKELMKRGLHTSKRKFIIDGNEVTYTEQTKIELQRFIDKGFASYFLITEDLLKFGAGEGWPFGPRGCTTSDALIDIGGSEQKVIEDIQPGDIIKDGFGDDQVVENKFIYDVSEDLFVFELDDRIIKVTRDHKLYIIRNEVVMLLMASDIKDTDEIIGSQTGRIDNHEDSKGIL
jgi:DNA polymerase-3 subunit alpha